MFTCTRISTNHIIFLCFFLQYWTGAIIIDAKTIKEFSKELQKALISADVDVDLVVALTKRLEDAF